MSINRIVYKASFLCKNMVGAAYRPKDAVMTVTYKTDVKTLHDAILDAAEKTGFEVGFSSEGMIIELLPSLPRYLRNAYFKMLVSPSGLYKLQDIHDTAPLSRVTIHKFAEMGNYNLLSHLLRGIAHLRKPTQTIEDNFNLEEDNFIVALNEIIGHRGHVSRGLARIDRKEVEDWLVEVRNTSVLVNIY